MLFILGMLICYVGLGFLLPNSWGIYATLGVQLFFVGAPLFFVLAFGADMKHVFSFHKPKLTGIGGTVVLWLGSMILNLAVSMVLTLLFPSALAQTADLFTSLVGDTPALVLCLIIAVLPAIGEELTFRGVFLTSMKRFRPWVAAVIVGTVFGAFHMDMIKLLPTAFIGVLLCFMRMESGNMFYNSLFHFLNNFVSVCALLFLRFMMGVMPDYGEILENAEQITGTFQSSMLALGFYWMLAIFGPFLIYLGFWLLKRAKDKTIPLFPRKTLVRNILAVSVPSLVLFVGSILFFLFALKIL